MRALFLSLVMIAGFGAFASEINLVQWNQMGANEKVNAIFNGELDEEELYGETLSESVIAVHVDAMVKDAAKKIDTEEIEQSVGGEQNIVTVGPARLSSVIVYKVEGQIVAIGIHLYQDGGAHDDVESLETWHFDSEEEAKAAGVDTSADVNWSGEAQFLWDGEMWEPLNYTDHEGRGFSWSGW